MALAAVAMLLVVGCASATGGRMGPAKPKLDSGTIVFIHGMYMTPACWSEWQAFFEKNGFKTMAPAWPLHSGTPAELRGKHPDPKLAALQLKEVVEHYAKLIRPMQPQPILVGHSMGGLVVQLLLAKGLGQAGVAIHSAPPKGVISLRWSFVRSNWGAISPFADDDEPILLTPEQFHYGWAHTMKADQAKQYYMRYAVPESRRIGRAPDTDQAKIEFSKRSGPLLFVAGGLDHTIPATLNQDNYKAYESAKARTEMIVFARRTHLTLNQPGWEKVAAAVLQWLRGE